MAILDRDRKEWAHHPVTQAFLSDLKETRQSTREAWGRGNLTRASIDETIQVNSEAIGGVSILTQTIDIIEEWQALETGQEELERVTS
jgi:hypothetical protein